MPNPGSDRPSTSLLASPPLVAVAGWLLPGAGYWLIGERARGLTVGVTIIVLFLMGMLIGGVRAIQVPGYGDNGKPLYAWIEYREKSGMRPQPTGVVKVTEDEPDGKYLQGPRVAGDVSTFLREVGNKPWSICQVMAGPIAFAGGAWSVSASRPVEEEGKVVVPAAGVASHSRVNEIAVLYTAVAGMLNLMVIIDAAARAGHLAEVAAYSTRRRSPYTSISGAS